MTIEPFDHVKDLLEAARSFCRLAENETNRPSGELERAAQYATIAQACATTAQAMILHQSTATIANDNGRVLMVDTGD